MSDLHQNDMDAAGPPPPSHAASRFDRLYQLGKTQMLSRKAAVSTDPECTFRPKLSARRNQPSSSSTTPRFEALYKQARVRDEKRQQLVQQTDSQYTFSPSINSKRGTQRSGNVFNNLYERAKQQKERKDAAAAPRPASATRKWKGEVSARLYNKEKLTQKQKDLEKARAEREVAECTFSPMLQGRPKTAPARRSAEETKKVYQKLYEDSTRLQAKRDDMRRHREEEETRELTFHPNLDITRPSTESHLGLSQRDTAEAYERLYQNAVDLRQRREDIAVHKQLDGCTFRPQISERSLALSAQAGRVHGGSPRFEELWLLGTKLQNTRRSMSEYRREEDISDSELQECTFKPRINEAPSRRLFTFDQQEMQDGAAPITAEEEAALDLDLDEDNVQTPPAGQAHSNGGVVVNGTDVYM